ncbi:MAG: hypothetical protein LQ338_004633 [Usnochroma carphineum]|nr:MAG: hypothetical protein LQ338_004633 [Usnochroma carphineum]
MDFVARSSNDPLKTLLYGLIYGSTISILASAEFLTAARETQGTESCFPNLSAQIISLAANILSCKPHLVGLIASIMQSASVSFPSEMRVCFVKEFATATRHRETKEGLTHVNDALFILSTALEGHASSHKLPDVDVPAAAQYMIHAGELVFNECKKGTGQDLATTSPLWATRGKLWTGPPGLSRERWDFWKGRFEEAAESEENIAEETKKTARTAVRAMAHVEALEQL